MKLYTNEAIDKLATKYINGGGNIKVISDGCLAVYGLAIFYGDNLKTAIVKEKYLNEWSSGNIIKMYNKMPKKYAKMIV